MITTLNQKLKIRNFNLIQRIIIVNYKDHYNLAIQLPF